MYFKVNCGKLKKAVKVVIDTITKKSAMPVLENFMFGVRDVNVVEGELIITGTNLEVTMYHKLGVETENKFDFLVPANFLTSLLLQLDEGQEIVCRLAENRKLEITSKEGKYYLPTLDVKEYPEAPDFKMQEEICISGATLKEALDYVNYAIDDNGESLRRAMEGVLIESTANNITLVTTDGKKLSRFTINQQTSKNISLIFPELASQILKKILPNEEVTINLDNKGYIKIECGEVTFFSRLIDAKFPDYKAILPKQDSITASFKVNRKEFLDAVKTLVKLSNEQSKKVVLVLKGNELSLAAYTMEEDEGLIKVNCSDVHGEIKIGFNGYYLVDVFSAIKENEVVVEMTTPQSAALMHGNDYTLNLVMPMRM